MSNIIGIDVSEHNGKLNWAKIKAAGISFAIIRCGYGKSTVDSCFKANVEGCIANGIPFGIYHFSYALNEAGAKNEAAFVLSLLAPYKDKITMPVFFDFEYDTVNYAQKQGVTLGKAAFNAHTLAFCNAIKAAGYKAGTYFNLDYYNRFVDKNTLAGLTVWFAQYNSTAQYSGYDLWQYSSSFKIGGHSCNFDVNNLKNTDLLKTTPKESEKKPMNEKRYNSLAEMPDYAVETISKLIDNGSLKGSGTKKDENGKPADLDLSIDMIRMLVINDRAGLYN